MAYNRTIRHCEQSENVIWQSVRSLSTYIRLPRAEGLVMMGNGNQLFIIEHLFSNCFIEIWNLIYNYEYSKN